MLDTLAMSIAGTALAVVLSLPLALLAAPNTAPIRSSIRAAHGARGSAFGAGDHHRHPLCRRSRFRRVAGVLALACIRSAWWQVLCRGHRTRGSRPLEAARAAGASPFQVITHAVLPQVLPQLADITIYRWEYHFRASAVLGIVGAGGIGFELMAALRLIKYDEVAAILFTILACVVVVDGIGARLRKKLK